MEDYKIKANEQFFSNILNVLTEGGKYMFPKAMQTYTKENNKLVGNVIALSHIKDIVSDKFYNENFKLKE
jgi:hypothetical protein